MGLLECASSNSVYRGYDYYNCESGKGVGSYNKENYVKLREDFKRWTDT